MGRKIGLICDFTYHFLSIESWKPLSLFCRVYGSIFKSFSVKKNVLFSVTVWLCCWNVQAAKTAWISVCHCLRSSKIPHFPHRNRFFKPYSIQFSSFLLSLIEEIKILREFLRATKSWVILLCLLLIKKGMAWVCENHASQMYFSW